MVLKTQARTEPDGKVSTEEMLRGSLTYRPCFLSYVICEMETLPVG